MDYKDIANRLRKWANGETCEDCPAKDDLAFCAADAITYLLDELSELEAKNMRLQGQVENANVARSKWEWLYHTEADKNRYLVTECCPHCDTESTLMWSVEEHGYQIYCPVCGKKIMLCSMCGHDCDWTEESGCKNVILEEALKDGKGD